MIFDTDHAPFGDTIQKRMKGSVLVVGGGIAGMQAALDCADAGFKVYLLEEQPSIGGNMARLDKTFPTNDCSMCMISPKLVETGRHLNIDIISYADLLKLEGEPGNFRATIRKRARYVDEVTCNGCGDCERECPVTITDSFNGMLKDRNAIYRLYPQAIPNVFTIDKRMFPPPCRGACPAGVNAQGYVGLIAKGKFLRALDLVRERMPFAGACGRICHHPCEQNCNRNEIDEAVSVRNLKRFLADYERGLIEKGLSIERPPSEIPVPEKHDYAEKVAIVGGGPAGLTCADDLAKKGYPVTVFDANERLGGMMRIGIPAYRLPRDFLDFEIDLILKNGIAIETGTALGRDFTLNDLKARGFNAVFLATGAHKSRKLYIPNEDADGVMSAIEFLKRVNLHEELSIGKRVGIIGGGNAAVDAARSAVRIHTCEKVTILYRRTRAEMPAFKEEVDAVFEEGIDVRFLCAPTKIVTENGKVSGVECIRMTLGEMDESGRRRPVPIEGSEFAIDLDTLIVAIGEEPDTSFTVGDHGIALTKQNTIKVDPQTNATYREGVFAGGDNVLGPASLVEAVEHGHRAAESIHRYLRGLDMHADRKPVEKSTQFADIPEDAERTCTVRTLPQTADPNERKRSFAEIEVTFTEEEAVTEAKRCLNCGGCCLCLECVRVCKAHAIDHDMKEQMLDIEVGAVVLTGGFDTFDPTLKAEYGFGRFPNIVTSMQFERILSASGPYEGHLKRPSDGKVPVKIAWIQCVGSRDTVLGNDYCSSVCCMYATKEAIIAKEHERGVEPTIFYTDMRAFGKGFESFYNRACSTAGVRYIRSQISSVKENPSNRNIMLRYVSEDTGRIAEEEFDLVVLSAGLVAHHSTGRISEVTGIARNRFGFAESDTFEQSKSSRKGIFLSGAVSGPKDIPETVMQSSAAAALCGELLAAVRGAEVRIKEYPTEKPVEGEEPRIGIFICHCGTNIASVVDVKAVADYAGSLGGVVYAQTSIYTCSQDSQELIKQTIREKNLNRVIVASCTPRTHEPLFRETIREAGLNQYLFEMVNIREQCSWVHQRQPREATEKAKSLVRGGVGKSRLLEPLRFSKVGVTKAALVIGGGISGMSSSLSLARQGFRVYLVEKEGMLGGNLRRIKRSVEGNDWQEYLDKTIEEVRSNKNIEVFLNTGIDEVSGFVGNFTTKLKGHADSIKHGIIIVATGANEYRTADFLHGSDERVITQLALEEKLDGDFHAETVVMIQCVGSRNSEHEYCSRVCCTEAVKNALLIKEKKPDATVYILYRDLRTYEFKELYYRKAREKGVRFIRFPDERYPEVSNGGENLRVSVHDAVIGETIELDPDLVVLSVATEPDHEGNGLLAGKLKVPLDRDGFFMEAHVKLRPVDFANEGIFVCGLAHSPKLTEENITQALASAGRAACILSKDSLEVGGVISVVDQEKCATCLTCVRECVYNAPFINNDGKAEIEAAKCQGCGNCVAACPAKAIQLATFTDMQEKALFYSILSE